MIETWFARLRFAGSVAVGTPLSVRSLERVIDAALATRREFGTVGVGPLELVGGGPIDQDTRQWIGVRGFRRQAVRAARETRYYADLFDRIGCDPSALSASEIAELPLTPKEALREQPDAFVCRSSEPFLGGLTTGTTGRPTCVAYSVHELNTLASMAAFNGLVREQITPEDILQISISLRSSLATTVAAACCARLGASSYLAGLIEPAAALQMLSEKRSLPGKRSRASVMLTYASYLGELVEQGRELGYTPGDFGLRSIRVGGEIVTEGLRDRTRALFGPVEFEEGYGITELVPMDGAACSEGHLHFQPSTGLLEVQSLEGPRPAEPDELGRVVGTPFGPFRETTVLLRYDTQDVVRALRYPLECSLRNLPAITKPLGRLSLSVQHDEGWTFQRDVMEAIDPLDAVPLPARYGFWRVPGGVGVEVFTRSQDHSVKGAVATALEEHDVPLRELHLVDDPRHLRHPQPVRADLREVSFERGTPHRPALIGAT